jgi:hypothetical protein
MMMIMMTIYHMFCVRRINPIEIEGKMHPKNKRKKSASIADEKSKSGLSMRKKKTKRIRTNQKWFGGGCSVKWMPWQRFQMQNFCVGKKDYDFPP